MDHNQAFGRKGWPTVHRVIVAAAAIGLASSALGAAVAVGQGMGLTPAGLHFHVQSLRSGLTIGSLPAEYVAHVWFLGTIILYSRRPLNPMGPPSAFFGGAAVTGGGVWFLLTRNQQCWPVVVATLAAAFVLGGAVLDHPGWAVASAPSRDPWNRVRAAAFAAVAALLGVAIHLYVSRVPPSDAARANLLRWYSAQSAGRLATSGGLTSADGIRVTVFTDYQSIDDRADVPRKAATIAIYRNAGVPVDFMLRDFPQDPHCNPSTTRVNDAACDAAYLARLARSRSGDVGASVTSWLYQRGPALSATLIRDRLVEVGLSEDFETALPQLRSQVKADIELARKMGIAGTPVYFVNGIWIPNGADVMRWVVDYELSRHDRTIARRN